MYQICGQKKERGSIAIKVVRIRHITKGKDMQNNYTLLEKIIFGDMPRISMSDSMLAKPTQIKDLFLELIGEDEESERIFGPGMPSFQRDQLRRELREKISQL